MLSHFQFECSILNRIVGRGSRQISYETNSGGGQRIFENDLLDFGATQSAHFVWMNVATRARRERQRQTATQYNNLFN